MKNRYLKMKTDEKLPKSMKTTIKVLAIGFDLVLKVKYSKILISMSKISRIFFWYFIRDTGELCHCFESLFLNFFKWP